jgi:DNA-binding transcriptional regulator YiaG
MTTRKPVNGTRVKQARQICRLSQKELADKIHVTEHQLVRYETNLEEMPQAALERLAIVLSWPMAFFRQDDPPSFSEGSMIFHYKFDSEF